MAAYRRVYDSHHLQADCQEPGLAPQPYALQSSMGYLFTSRSQFFSERAATLWNSLPGDRVNLSFLRKFNSSLKSTDLLSLVLRSLSVPSFCYYVYGYFYVCMF